MDIPTITGDQIAHFHKLFGEFKALESAAQNELAAARLNDDKDITITRNGEEITLQEKTLWHEVFHRVTDGVAQAALEAKYPRVFELSRQAEEKKAEMKVYTVANWKVDPLAMSLSDIMRFVEGMLDYKLSQRV